MTKAEIVNEVAKATGIEKAEVLSVLEASMECVKNSVASGEPVYLRGFAHYIPAFKPAKVFVESLKENK